jgi:iron complex outermembrane receptor protein
MRASPHHDPQVLTGDTPQRRFWTHDKIHGETIIIIERNTRGTGANRWASVDAPDRRCVSHRRPWPLAAAIAAVLYGTVPAAAAAAAAATAADADAQEIGEITVTASRRTERVQDIPYSISAVSGDKLAENNITDIARLTQSVPGLVSFDAGAGGNDNRALTIRGLNSGGLNTNQTVAPVAVYVNDTPVFLNLRLKDIDRVEVLRGPQGTLYGSGALGGAVRFIQHSPDLRDFDVQATAGGSSTEHASGLNDELDLVVNLPIISDVFGLRFNIDYSHDAGYIAQPNLYVLDSSGAPVPKDPTNLITSPAQMTSRRGTNDNTYKSARIAALWKPADNVKVDLNIYHQASEAGNSQTTTPLLTGWDSLESAHYIAEALTDRVDLQSLELTVDAGFASITSTTSHFHHENVSTGDYTTLYQLFSFYTPYYGANPRPLYLARQTYDDTGTVEELRMISQWSGPVQLVAGVYFNKDATNVIHHEFAPGYQAFYNACEPVHGPGNICGIGTQVGIYEQVFGIPIVTDESYVGDSEANFTDRAVYGEVTWHITSAWQATGGIRAFSQSYSQTNQTGLMFDGPLFASVNSRSISDKHALYKANTSYKITEDMMVYATYAQGFRRGGVNALPASTLAGGVTDPRFFTLKPDYAYNSEVGIKGSIAKRYQYSLSAYNIDWKNIQSGLYLTPLSIISTANIGDGYSRGVELEFSGRLVGQLYGQIGYAYDETKLKTASFQALNATVATVPGGSLPNAPKETLSASLDYKVPVGGDWVLDPTASLYYRGPMNTATTANRFPVGGFATATVSMSVDHGHWHGLLYINNATNKLGFNSAPNTDTWGQGAAVLVNQPRTAGVMLTYKLAEK